MYICMDEDNMLALACISIIPLCSICCIVAFCYENFCKKAVKITEENKIEENNYNELV